MAAAFSRPRPPRPGAVTDATRRMELQRVQRHGDVARLKRRECEQSTPNLNWEWPNRRMAFRSPTRFKVIGVLGDNLVNTTISQNPKLRNYDYKFGTFNAL